MHKHKLLHDSAGWRVRRNTLINRQKAALTKSGRMNRSGKLYVQRRKLEKPNGQGSMMMREDIGQTFLSENTKRMHIVL